MVSLDGKPVSSMKVVDLKEELRKRGLNLGGLKKDLVERLEAAILEEEEKNDKDTGLSPDITLPDPVEKQSIVEESPEKARGPESDLPEQLREEAEQEQQELSQEKTEQIVQLSETDQNVEPSEAPLPVSRAEESSIELGQASEKAVAEDCQAEEATEEAAPEQIVDVPEAAATSDEGKGKEIESSQGQVAEGEDIVTKDVPGTEETTLAEDWVLVSRPAPEEAEEAQAAAAQASEAKEAAEVAAASDVEMAAAKEEAEEKVEAMAVETVKEGPPLSTGEDKGRAAAAMDPMEVVEKEFETPKEKATPAPGSKRKEEETRGGEDSSSKRLRRLSTETPPSARAGEAPKEGGSVGGSGGLRGRMDAKLFPAGAARHTTANNGSAEKSNGGGAARHVPPPNRAPSTSLLINNFLRPFTDRALKELLAKTGTVEKLWLAAIKTHCYVTFSTVSEAEATRNALHNLQWPPQHGKHLQVTFVEPADVDNAVEKGTAGPSPPVAAVPGVPPAPRVISPVLPPPPRERLPPPPKKEPEPVLPSLDDLFKRTKAKPQLYYLPLTDEQVAAKLEARKAGTDAKRGAPEKGRK